jgi:dynein heavy chain
VSNEIINRCRSSINLENIFGGDRIEGTINILEQSIYSGEHWKQIYKDYEDNSSADGINGWKFEYSNIFAQIDAFVQRCKELLEICEAQIHFSKNHSSMTLSLSFEQQQQSQHLLQLLEQQQKASQELVNIGYSVFGGSTGPEITKSLNDIELSFEKLILQLKQLNYDILDVKAAKWHDDYNTFKKGVKDLEVMMRNVINR